MPAVGDRMIVEPPPSVLTLGGGAMPTPPTVLTAVAADVGGGGGGARPNAPNPPPLSPLIVPAPVALSDPDPDRAAPCAILLGMFTVTVPLSE